jgi:predicted NBD/HSP70 family sugar kinase
MSTPLPARRRRTRDQVLEAVTELGSATRAELCHTTRLSRSAVSECVGDLLGEGLITESTRDLRPAGRGRRAGVLSVRSARGVVLGVDLGHAHVTAAIATSVGEVLAECSDQLDVDHVPRRALDLAAALARRALRQCGRRVGEVRSAAAGIPGPLQLRPQIVSAPTILSDWVGIDPAAELEGRLGVPVVVGNDADMGAVGERAYGAAQGLDDFLYIKASHGIGAGIVLAGNTYRGATGLAGEIGHTQIPGATRWCRCGSRGCLEAVVSISNLRRQLAHVLSTNTTLLQDHDVPPLAELADNSSAARVITDAGRTVGRVVADLVNCLNPAAVVLGGELGEAGLPFASGVRESIDRYAQPASAAALKVLPARLGARAELLGTVATALRTHASGPKQPPRITHHAAEASGAGFGSPIDTGRVRR